MLKKMRYFISPTYTNSAVLQFIRSWVIECVSWCKKGWNIFFLFRENIIGGRFALIQFSGSVMIVGESAAPIFSILPIRDDRVIQGPP